MLFIQDGRLHYVYNFLGEEEQKLSSSDAVPLGKHTFGVAFARTGTVEGSHTPLGDAALYIDDAEVASLSGMKIHPGHVRARRRQPERRDEHRIAGVARLQGAVPVHRWHHRTGEC